MAKRTATRSRTTTVVQQPAPIVLQTSARRRSSGRRRRSPKRRRARAGGGGGGSLKNRMLGVGVGGFAVGFIEKNWGDKIPAIPIVGRKGAIAIGAYFLAPKHPFIVDVGIAAAALAGYEFGKEGHVTGEDDDLIASQT